MRGHCDGGLEWREVNTSQTHLLLPSSRLTSVMTSVRRGETSSGMTQVTCRHSTKGQALKYLFDYLLSNKFFAEPPDIRIEVLSVTATNISFRLNCQVCERNDLTELILQDVSVTVCSLTAERPCWKEFFKSSTFLIPSLNATSCYNFTFKPSFLWNIASPEPLVGENCTAPATAPQLLSAFQLSNNTIIVQTNTASLSSLTSSLTSCDYNISHTATVTSPGCPELAVLTLPSPAPRHCLQVILTVTDSHYHCQLFM